MNDNHSRTQISKTLRDLSKTVWTLFKNLIRWIWHNRVLILAVLTVPLFIVLLIFQPYDQKEDVYSPSTPLLFPDTSKHFSASEVSTHNSNLRTKLQADIAVDAGTNASQQALKMQTRMAYLALMAALVGIVAANSKFQTKTIGVSLIALIVAMYGLDVHNDDLNKRSTNTTRIQSREVEFLVNLDPDCPISYVIKGDSLRNQSKYATASCQTRKFHNATHPSIDQRIFYLIPVLCVYVSMLWRGWRPQRPLNEEEKTNKKHK